MGTRLDDRVDSVKGVLKFLLRARVRARGAAGTGVWITFEYSVSQPTLGAFL